MASEVHAGSEYIYKGERVVALSDGGTSFFANGVVDIRLEDGTVVRNVSVSDLE